MGVVRARHARAPSVIQDGSVGAVLPVHCPEIRDVRYSGVFNVCV